MNVQLNVPKESKEILDTALGIIKSVMNKEEVAVILTSNLPKLITAVDGYDKVSLELSSAERSDLLAYAVKSLADTFAPVN